MSSLADKPYYIVPTCHERVGTIYRDDHVLLINKPAFLLSVPGRAPENKDCAVRQSLLGTGCEIKAAKDSGTAVTSVGTAPRTRVPPKAHARSARRGRSILIVLRRPE